MSTTLQTIDIPLLEQVSELIEHRTGLHFPYERFADLERGLARTAQEAGCGDVRAYAKSLLSHNLKVADIDLLAGCLTIGESHFFRDITAFAFFETTLLPALIAAKRRADRCLRILSAGCAAGEEPYSIAMLLHRLIPDLDDWHITVLGADINPKALARAAAGIYTAWSFRDTPEWVKPKYFIPIEGKRYEIQPCIKRMVTFTCLNLAEDVYPSDLNNTSAFDLIVCRNVLIYFAPARICEVVRRFHCALVEDGQLVLGTVEASQMMFPEFMPLPAHGMAMYRKKHADEYETPETAPRMVAGHTAIVQPSITTKRFSGPQPNEEVPLARPAPWFTCIMPTPKVAWDSVLTVANSMVAAGRYREACTVLLSTAEGRHEDSPQVSTLLAQCHVNLGKYEEALVWCERALAAGKTYAELHFLRARILQRMERNEEALAALRNVLFLDPCHVLAHLAAANLHRRKGRTDVAARHVATIRRLLASGNENEEMPHAGGFTVGRLNAMLAATMGPAPGKDVIAHE